MDLTSIMEGGTGGVTVALAWAVVALARNKINGKSKRSLSLESLPCREHGEAIASHKQELIGVKDSISRIDVNLQLLLKHAMKGDKPDSDS